MELGSDDFLKLLWSDARLVMPEIWLVGGMCAVILVPFVRRKDAMTFAVVALAGLGAALVTALPTIGRSEVVFSGMLAIDPFSQVFKVLLLLFTMFIVVQWLIVTRDQTNVLDVPDFMCLLLGATFGMALMASANNLLAIFVATESASLPSFALAGFRKRHPLATEGSLKYVIFGAASSAVMIYGMSLIYGTTGSLGLAPIAAASSNMSPLLAVGLLAMFAGIAFKLSAVPMHFWCPDVFQGAPIEVTTFLSVASKGAAVCLLVRVLAAFGATGSHVGLMVGVGVLGAITATWGNLVALHQTNIKRLLAYSSIAHSGYMIMTASVIAVAPGVPEIRSVAGVILFYLLIYSFMNLGAFTVAAVIARQTGTEDITEYAGMRSRSPLLAVLLSMFLLSLFGMPGLGGFRGKIYLMSGMVTAGKTAGLVLVAVLLINTLLSLYYYMRPVIYMYLTPDTEQRPSFVLHAPALAMLVICAVVLLWTGLLPNMAGQLTTPYGVLALPTVAAPLADAAATATP